MSLVDYVEQSNSLLLLLFLAVAADGIFPPLPSELLVLSVIAVAAATGNPPLWHLLLTIGFGAMLGDHLAYGAGNRLAARSKGAVRSTLDRASTPLEQHGATALLVARFVPAGRVAVNAAAGATRFPYRTFFLVTIAASAAWAGYCGLIGTFSAHWSNHNPLAATAFALAIALAVGAAVDLVRRRRTARRAELSDFESR